MVTKNTLTPQLEEARRVNKMLLRELSRIAHGDHVLDGDYEAAYGWVRAIAQDAFDSAKLSNGGHNHD